MLTSQYIGQYSKKIDSSVQQINSLFFNQTIPPIGTAVGSFWIGGSDMLVEGEWEWMTSHKLITFTDWASGEPADFLNQDCLDIKGSVHYHWNDSPCSYLHWFICEKHVYVLQLLTLIIVRVLYLKLKKKKKNSISALGFCDFVQNSWKIFSFCQYVGNFPNINDKYRSTL